MFNRRQLCLHPRKVLGGARLSGPSGLDRRCQPGLKLSRGRRLLGEGGLLGLPARLRLGKGLLVALEPLLGRRQSQLLTLDLGGRLLALTLNQALCFREPALYALKLGAPCIEHSITLDERLLKCPKRVGLTREL